MKLLVLQNVFKIEFYTRKVIDETGFSLYPKIGTLNFIPDGIPY